MISIQIRYDKQTVGCGEARTASFGFLRSQDDGLRLKTHGRERERCGSLRSLHPTAFSGFLWIPLLNQVSIQTFNDAERQNC
ncbi:protein of unknown function [Methylocaldum szegediense]|uniref:Uncharacterized protein n=1 Tax=Methylocaldum szegediense TaxID=73780 RepID=A0ABN8X4E5_9GAMM|nr:protein of unknown function [Methylocaldum szegediense]